MSNEKEYLFLLTIGPVKSFIQDSRKAQDLFASSSLLSNMCRDALVNANKKFNSFELITPNINIDSVFIADTHPSIPNRFLAKIKGDATSLLKIAKQVENKVKDDFKIILFNNKAVVLPNGTEIQLQNHLDIRWVFTELNGNYSEAFGSINKKMAAIKNFKPFKFLNETGRKCIVDGKLNVKFYRESKKGEINSTKPFLNKLYQKKEDVIVLGVDDKKLAIWHLQKGEGISAVSLKKRLFQNKPHQFPSTAKIALLHIFNDLKEDSAFISFKEKVQGSNDNKNEGKYFDHSNDQLFYKENISPIFEKENETNTIPTAINDHEKWSKNLILPFTKYYALIRFDGDDLGDWFSGNNKKPSIDLIDYHRHLSALLIVFADTIKVQVNENKGNGSVIYAGGEDFMAMLNLHQLQNTIAEIRNLFDTLVSKPMQEWIANKKDFTLSFGITIAHYKEPLQMILDKTAKMESFAKKNGKNRWAMQISKHSGGQIITSLPWFGKNKKELMPVLFDVINQIELKNISSAFLLKTYNFCDALDFDNNVKEIIKSKKKLYIERAILKDKENTFTSVNTALDLFLDEISTLEFANLLVSMDFIQRHDYAKKI